MEQKPTSQHGCGSLDMHPMGKWPHLLYIGDLELPILWPFAALIQVYKNL